ncbi:MAG: DHHA1 domain-containing protein, partial [Salinisphaera sp.]|nr:DHHA1 domain-containing protein [Salinisphaera sp.]
RYGDYSVELCGGTHVDRSGEIGLFKFSEERGVAAGVRRIEAVTGNGALDWVRGQNERLQRLSAQLKAAPAEAEAKLEKTLERLAELERQLGQLGARLASTLSDELAAQAADIGGVRVLAARLDAADRKALRETLDTLKSRLVTAVVVLGAVADGRVALIAGATSDVAERIPAGELVNFVAGQVGGRGGGRADMAQAGGDQPQQLDAALASVLPHVEQALAAVVSH